MICPYFWYGGSSKTCEAYTDSLMIPSINEEQNYCVSSNHVFCHYYLMAKDRDMPWLRQRKEEVSV